MLVSAETKLNHDLANKISSFIKPSWSNLHNLAQVPYGRLHMLWNPSYFPISPHFIHSVITHIESSTTFNFTAVYAENSNAHRQVLLDYIPTFLASSISWICLGDWNCMQYANDKLGGTPLSTNSTKPLNNAIQEANLLPINGTGCFFTWSVSSLGETTVRQSIP